MEIKNQTMFFFSPLFILQQQQRLSEHHTLSLSSNKWLLVRAFDVPPQAEQRSAAADEKNNKGRGVCSEKK